MENTKTIERILFTYKEIPLKIKKLELEIRIVENTYDTLNGKSDNEIMPGSRNNKISSSVENALINKEARIERLKEEIKRQQFNREMIDIALESLTEIERKIIEDKYFNKLSYYKLSEKYYFSKEWAYYTCQKIIENKIAPYIINV
ncbi:MAG: hypothetical protein AB9856_20810 [Cellulosilyticaceae bacterium]